MGNLTSPALVLVDGSSYLYRAYHAMPSLTNSLGEPTGAVYGVVNMLKRLLKDYQSANIAVVFDAPGDTFRHKIYASYKANRSKMPHELIAQIEPLYAIIKALGIPLICEPGVEADDIIGTFAQVAAADGLDVLISTGDKDFAQLVSTKITLVNTMTNSILDPAAVKAKFGVEPAKIIDYLALIGDVSDNVPGVKKVGPKTAVKWLEEYGSLDNLIKNAHEIKGKVGENLRESVEQIPLAKNLVTIRTNLKLSTKYNYLKLDGIDKPSLQRLYQKLEFKTWLTELLDLEKGAEEKIKYETILTSVQLDQWIRRLEKNKIFTIDTETTNLEPMRARLVGISFADKKNNAAYLPLAHTDTKLTQINKELAIKKLRGLLENPKIKKIGHHIKYDITILKNAGIELLGIESDTLIESALLNGGVRHDMDSLALKYLNHSTIKFTDVAGKGVNQVTFDKVEIEKASDYAAEDADITLQLHEIFSAKFSGKKQLKKVLTDIELPLISVLAEMEQVGVKVDSNLLLQQTKKLEKKLLTIQKKVFALTCEEFNLNSPKQLQKILFETMQLPIISKTPKGQPSTAESVLQELAQTYELPGLIIEHRSLAKLVNTYTKKLPELINEKTGRIHTNWHQLGAATGRLSSSDPNLQNIPVKTDIGREIRQAFIAEENFVLISADYSQIELRIMAHMSEDESLLQAFANGEDIHIATAADVLNIKQSDVTASQRRDAKAINFGLIYGMSAFGLAKQLKVDRITAQNYIDCYFAKFPGVAKYMEMIREKAHKDGFVETLWGRRLYLQEINSKNVMRQKAAERTAINAPLQGTAADIIKRAMISLSRSLKPFADRARIIMQVHDELVLEVANEQAAEIQQLVKTNMINAASLKVPLDVSIGVGLNWDAASGK